MLVAKNISLISVAITSDVNPTTMTILSNLHGGKNLILVKDDDETKNFYHAILSQLDLDI